MSIIDDICVDIEMVEDEEIEAFIRECFDRTYEDYEELILGVN